MTRHKAVASLSIWSSLSFCFLKVINVNTSTQRGVQSGVEVSLKITVLCLSATHASLRLIKEDTTLQCM